MSPLWGAISNCSHDVVKLLLKKGCLVNVKLGKNGIDWILNDACTGQTALHGACEPSTYWLLMSHGRTDYGKPSIVRTLLEYGADANSLDDENKTPLMWAKEAKTREMLVVHLAKLKFEGRSVCKENLKYIKQQKDFHEIFQDCLKKLAIMRDFKIYNDFSLYDILQMKKHNFKTLIQLTKKEDFVTIFESRWNTEYFKHFAKDLHYIFEKALKKGNILKAEEKKIHESGLAKKFSLPPEIVEMIAYFVN